MQGFKQIRIIWQTLVLENASLCSERTIKDFRLRVLNVNETLPWKVGEFAKVCVSFEVFIRRPNESFFIGMRAVVLCKYNPTNNKNCTVHKYVRKFLFHWDQTKEQACNKKLVITYQFRISLLSNEIHICTYLTYKI